MTAAAMCAKKDLAPGFNFPLPSRNPIDERIVFIVKVKRMTGQE